MTGRLRRFLLAPLLLVAIGCQAADGVPVAVDATPSASASSTPVTTAAVDGMSPSSITSARPTNSITRPSSSSSSSSATSDVSTPRRSTSTGTSVTTTEPSLAATYQPPTECLFTIDEVESVLGGTWSLLRPADLASGPCAYTNDRGALVLATTVEYAPDEMEEALAEVRVTTCDTPAEEVPGTGGGFICSDEENDLLHGNIIARGHFWLVMIGIDGDPDSVDVKTDAIAALLSIARR